MIDDFYDDWDEDDFYDGEERIGADPELAFVDPKGIATSAHLVWGDERKEYLIYVNRETKKGFSLVGSEVERDGAALEVRPIVESACRDNLIPYMGEALKDVIVTALFDKYEHLHLDCYPKYILSEASLKNAPEDVRTFGCHPDLSAYTLERKQPLNVSNGRDRFLGGHLHWSPTPTVSRGDSPSALGEQAALAVLFDYVLALPFVAILGEEYTDVECERRENYGQAGSFRATNFKIEFRQLSSMIMASPLLMGWAMGTLRSMFKNPSGSDQGFGCGTNWVPSEVITELLAPVVRPSEVRDIIDTHDWEKARALYPAIYEAYPMYDENPHLLSNPIGGGGTATYNMYFYKKVVDLFVDATDNGLFWNTDVAWNWGLIDDYIPEHHSYWGIHSAMCRQMDDTIFPMNELLEKHVPVEYLAKNTTWTHPVNGGRRQLIGQLTWLS